VGSNKKYTDEIAALKKKNAELKSAEQLRPQLLDLQQQLAVMKKESEEREEETSDEIATLSDHNQKLAAAVIEYKKSSDRDQQELEHARSLYQALTERAKHLESEGRQLEVDLAEAREELEAVRAAAVDPLVVQTLEAKVEEYDSKCIFHVHEYAASTGCD
jgi:chromosome segregation ATPase